MKCSCAILVGYAAALLYHTQPPTAARTRTLSTRIPDSADSMDPLKAERRSRPSKTPKKSSIGLWLSLLIPAAALFAGIRWLQSEAPQPLPQAVADGQGRDTGSLGAPPASDSTSQRTPDVVASPRITGGVAPAAELQTTPLETFEPGPAETRLAGPRAIGGGDRLPPQDARSLSGGARDDGLCRGLQGLREEAETALAAKPPESEARLLRNQRDNAIQNMSRLKCLE